ncbi:hypothetical protein SISSUDRAFT_1067937 [Sistotremastrum suecicum HHB10207 ss-3]|uniref:Uncharacterized protein n=1 Tax=Sistotremastrum suecicum HHB10207 ss-3 TaxID=1314776 RepID=A0A165WJR5_9AGAM|nr:hypothetical protein SISSUDRAFT_1067937 [Sistotremastrum suecicum HHB10207 ss-3]
MSPATRSSLPLLPFSDVDFFVTSLGQEWFPDDPDYKCNISSWLKDSPKNHPARPKIYTMLKKYIDLPSGRPDSKKEFRTLLADRARALLDEILSPKDDSLEVVEDFIGCVIRSGDKGVKIFNSESIKHPSCSTSSNALIRLPKALEAAQSPSVTKIEKLVVASAKELFPLLDQETTTQTHRTLRTLLLVKRSTDSGAPPLTLFQSPEFAAALLLVFHTSGQAHTLSILLKQMLEDARLENFSRHYLSDYALKIFDSLRKEGVSFDDEPFSEAWHSTVRRYITNAILKSCYHVMTPETAVEARNYFVFGIKTLWEFIPSDKQKKAILHGEFKETSALYEKILETNTATESGGSKRPLETGDSEDNTRGGSAPKKNKATSK